MAIKDRMACTSRTKQDRKPVCYGYARVSTLDSDPARQRAALQAAGCEVIRAEKASGTRRDDRTELQALLTLLREGDTLVVTRIDRLARSVRTCRTSCTGCRRWGSR